MQEAIKEVRLEGKEERKESQTWEESQAGRNKESRIVRLGEKERRRVRLGRTQNLLKRVINLKGK
jgi:hypothetical protein